MRAVVAARAKPVRASLSTARARASAVVSLAPPPFRHTYTGSITLSGRGRGPSCFPSASCQDPLQAALEAGGLQSGSRLQRLGEDGGRADGCTPVTPVLLKFWAEHGQGRSLVVIFCRWEQADSQPSAASILLLCSHPALLRLLTSHRHVRHSRCVVRRNLRLISFMITPRKHKGITVCCHLLAARQTHCTCFLINKGMTPTTPSAVHHSILNMPCSTEKGAAQGGGPHSSHVIVP